MQSATIIHVDNDEAVVETKTVTGTVVKRGVNVTNNSTVEEQDGNTMKNALILWCENTT